MTNMNIALSTFDDGALATQIGIFGPLFILLMRSRLEDSLHPIFKYLFMYATWVKWAFSPTASPQLFALTFPSDSSYCFKQKSNSLGSLLLFVACIIMIIFIPFVERWKQNAGHETDDNKSQRRSQVRRQLITKVWGQLHYLSIKLFLSKKTLTLGICVFFAFIESWNTAWSKGTKN